VVSVDSFCGSGVSECSIVDQLDYSFSFQPRDPIVLQSETRKRPGNTRMQVVVVADLDCWRLSWKVFGSVRERTSFYLYKTQTLVFPLSVRGWSPDDLSYPDVNIPYNPSDHLKDCIRLLTLAIKIQLKEAWQQVLTRRSTTTF